VVAGIQMATKSQREIEMKYRIQRINDYGAVVDEDVDGLGPMSQSKAVLMRQQLTKRWGNGMFIMVPVPEAVDGGGDE
jgi:hypothetical protein